MDNRIRVFRWQQDVHAANADEFRGRLAGFAQTDAKLLMLVLQDVKYVNSVALGAIASGVLEARRSGKQLVVAGVVGTLREIFNIVKFSQFIQLFDTLEEAEAYLHTFVADKEDG